MKSQKFTYTFPDGSIIEEFKLDGKMHNAFGPARIIINTNGVRQIWKDKLGNVYGNDYYLNGCIMQQKEWEQLKNIMQKDLT